MPPGRGRPCDSNAPIESRPRPLHLLLWPLTGLQEWVWRAISHNAPPYRLAMSTGRVALIKSRKAGFLLAVGHLFARGGQGMLYAGTGA